MATALPRRTELASGGGAPAEPVRVAVFLARERGGLVQVALQRSSAEPALLDVFSGMTYDGEAPDKARLLLAPVGPAHTPWALGTPVGPAHARCMA